MNSFGVMFLSILFGLFGATPSWGQSSIEISFKALVESYRAPNRSLSESEREAAVSELEKEIRVRMQEGLVPATHLCRLVAMDVPAARTVLKTLIEADFAEPKIPLTRLGVFLGVALASGHPDFETSIQAVLERVDLVVYWDSLLEGIETYPVSVGLFQSLARALPKHLKFTVPIFQELAVRDPDLRAQAVIELQKYSEIPLEREKIDSAIGQFRVWGALAALDDVAFVEPVLKKIQEPNLEDPWNRELFFQTLHFVSEWICVGKPTPNVLSACRKRLGPEIQKTTNRADLPYEFQDKIEGILYSRYFYFTEPAPESLKQ